MGVSFTPFALFNMQNNRQKNKVAAEYTRPLISSCVGRCRAYWEFSAVRCSAEKAPLKQLYFAYWSPSLNPLNSHYLLCFSQLVYRKIPSPDFKPILDSLWVTTCSISLKMLRQTAAGCYGGSSFKEAWQRTVSFQCSARAQAVRRLHNSQLSPSPGANHIRQQASSVAA